MVSFRKYLYFWNGGWKKNLHNNRHFFEVLTARPPKQGILPMSFVIQLIEKAAHNTGVKKVFRVRSRAPCLLESTELINYEVRATNKTQTQSCSLKEEVTHIHFLLLLWWVITVNTLMKSISDLICIFSEYQHREKLLLWGSTFPLDVCYGVEFFVIFHL